MGIYVFEDNLLQSQAIVKIIMGICDLECYPKTDIICYSKSEDLFKAIHKDCRIHLFFLDIHTKRNPMSGLEIAKQIRQNDQNSVIVFITSHSELALQSYKYYSRATAFIEKTQNIKKMTDEISDVLKIYFSEFHSAGSHDIFYYDTKHSTFHFLFHEILFFESIYDHRIRCHTTNQIVDFYGTLNQISSMDDRLFRSHHSYVVNLLNIKKVNKSSRMIVVATDTEIPVSRSYYKDLMKKVLMCNEIERE